MATDPVVHLVPESDGDTLTAICGHALNGTDHTGHFTFDPKGRRNCPACIGLEDRAYQDCTCTACGSTHQCTPSSDFYTIPQDETALLCEACFAKHIAMPMRRVEM